MFSVQTHKMFFAFCESKQFESCDKESWYMGVLELRELVCEILMFK